MLILYLSFVRQSSCQRSLRKIIQHGINSLWVCIREKPKLHKHPNRRPKYIFCVHFYCGETRIPHVLNKIRSSSRDFFVYTNPAGTLALSAQANQGKLASCRIGRQPRMRRRGWPMLGRRELAILASQRACMRAVVRGLAALAARIPA
jgi:hypothetical protein